jgi:preprotein translocase subunit SecG
MQIMVLSIHLLVCVALIFLVLLQRSEGGALGMGGGGGALMSGRGAADALAKMTSFAGGFFLVTSLSLTFISGAAGSSQGSIFDSLPRLQQNVAPPTSTPAEPTPQEPARPDPTESLAPEATGTQLASATVQPTSGPTQQATIPSPTEARTRATPLEGRANNTAATSVPTSAPRTTGASQTQARQNPPPTTTRQTGGATNQQAATQTPAQRQGAPLTLPNTSGAATGTPVTPIQELATESSEGEGVVAVRRERAGPDQ